MIISTRSPLDDDHLDRLFKALSDRTRRALIARLSESAATISELAEPFDMSLPAVSKHLRVLESAGLVRRSIDGRVHTCSLQAAPLADAEAWLETYQRFWSETLDGLAAFAEET